MTSTHAANGSISSRISNTLSLPVFKTLLNEAGVQGHGCCDTKMEAFVK